MCLSPEAPTRRSCPGCGGRRVPPISPCSSRGLRTGLESDRIAVLYPGSPSGLFRRRALERSARRRAAGPRGAGISRPRAICARSAATRSVFASAYWLEIEVTDFQAEYASAGARPRCTCTCWRASAIRATGAFSANSRPTARQPAAENRLTAIVDAYARAADTAFAEIAGRADGEPGQGFRSSIGRWPPQIR